MTTKAATTAIEDEGARSFSTLIETLGEGTLHAEISEELRDAVKRLEQHAFGEACERAAKETELPLYQGTPEA